MRFSAMRLPKIPSELTWLAVGAALAPIAYGLAKNACRVGISKAKEFKKKRSETSPS